MISEQVPRKDSGLVAINETHKGLVPSFYRWETEQEARSGVAASLRSGRRHTLKSTEPCTSSDRHTPTVFPHGILHVLTLLLLRLIQTRNRSLADDQRSGRDRGSAPDVRCLRRAVQIWMLCSSVSACGARASVCSSLSLAAPTQGAAV